MSSTPPGWYENPADSTEIRYWDGRQWLDHTAPKPHATQPDARRTTPKPPKRKAPLWLVVASGAAGLVLGTMGGIGAGDAGRYTAQITELETQVDSLETEVDETQQAAEVADQALSEAQAEFTAERKKLVLEAKTATEEAATEQANAQQAKSEAQKAQAEAQAATKRALAAEGRQEADTTTSTTTSPEPPAATSTSYENCTAVRDAGASPIRVGQPGYGRHLDRDGDGVGCE